MQIAPHGWVCSGWLLPRRRPPSARSDLTATWRPGPYVGARATGRTRIPFFPSLRALARGRVWNLRGDVGFQVLARRRVMGRTYLVTRTGGLVAESAVSVRPPSSLVGLTLAHPGTLPLAIALRDTPLLRHAGARAVATGSTLPRYGVWPVRHRKGAPREVVLGKTRYLLLSGRHGYLVRAEEVALALRPPRPPAGLAPRQHWVDVDAAQRLVFAMRGPHATRVMLTSLGENTPTGTFRVEQKRLFKDMTRRYGDSPYFLEAVPFVVFFNGNFAFHGAYWHDGFGTHRSHGCLNLSLVDARFVFSWIGPWLPSGFFAIYPTPSDPGGVVRVRGRYHRRAWETPAP